jgi:hypothetical protein
MKSILALTIALAFGTAGIASAGMQGQGAKPDAKKPEYEERNPGPYLLREQGINKNKDTSISRTEAKVNRHLTEHFEELDKNGDNQLDKAELDAFETVNK